MYIGLHRYSLTLTYAKYMQWRNCGGKGGGEIAPMTIF